MTTDGQRTDGRAARAERTRDAVVEAFLTLTEEGHLRPTAKLISERAGVSLRSVFQHFEDLETLFAAAADRQVERLMPLYSEIPADIPFEDRLSRFVSMRSSILEAISPVRRSAVLAEPFSPVIQQRLRWFRERSREEVLRVFSGELAALPPDEHLTAEFALHAATEWYTWETLRTHSGLSLDCACSVMALTIRRLLAPAVFAAAS